MDTSSQFPRVAIIGAGPAGLTAAYVLAKAGASVHVIEADPRYVGGISKTVVFKNFLCDIGGHRFFSKSQEIEDLWTEILGDDLIERKRISRIFYRGKFFSYPLKPFEALIKLGPWEALLCGLSYLRSRLFPIANPVNFEQWVTNQFGGRLFRIFFKTYTEKVWGLPSSQISADWAAQRIKGLSLSAAVLNTFLPRPRRRQDVIKTQIDTFRYPRRGPGMMWEVCAQKIRGLGGQVDLGCVVTGCHFENGKWKVETLSGYTKSSIETDVVISTAPLIDLNRFLDPPLSPAAQKAATNLKYRDFLMVALIIRNASDFDDQWIYIHDPDVSVGRIQNFRAWSPDMVPVKDRLFLGFEYFCNENDDMWAKSDADLIALASRELEKIGLGKKANVEDGMVIRQKKAYPVYDDQYKTHVDVLRLELEKKYPGFYTVGRNGMHKYNNQDHSMMTAIYVANNILGREPKKDPWHVNIDADYIEEKESDNGASGERAVPARVLPIKD